MIVRAPRPDANFYVLNKAISEDRRLSWAARGLLVFLLGKPDHWQVSTANLINETAESVRPLGRDGVWGLLRELIDTGYCRRQQQRKADGTTGEMHYFVTETPAKTSTESAQTAPLTAKTPQVSIEEKARTEEKKESVREKKVRITFNPETGVFQVPAEIRQHLEDAYGQDINLDAELSRAQVWCSTNLTRRPRSDFGRFINGWMNRAAEAARQQRQRPGLRVVGSNSSSKQARRDHMADWLFGAPATTPKGDLDVVDVVPAESQ